MLALAVAVALLGWRLGSAAWRAAAASGRRPAPARRIGAGRAAPALLTGLLAVYGLVGATLLVLSVAGVWTFPAAWPQRLTTDAWQQVAAAAGTVGFTAALAAAASALALALTVAWLEATPAHWDRRAGVWVLAPLVLPPLLLMAGLYQAALVLRLDGSVPGLLWAHVLVVLPYSFITLQPAWRSFEPRYEALALALGRRRWAFWWRVKWPLLAAPLAAAAAVGFAVSVAQFLATQFLGAGRHATVTTEAVTLASGGQRTLAAAFALLQALLPLAGLRARRPGWRRRTIAAMSLVLHAVSIALHGRVLVPPLTADVGAGRGAGRDGRQRLRQELAAVVPGRPAGAAAAGRRARCCSTGATSRRCRSSSAASACCSRTTCCSRT